MKIVFFGDSITEAGRNLQDESDLGAGYVKIMESKLRLLYPDLEIEMLNRGVGGDKTEDLLKRVKKDVIAQKPDYVILQVGVNDVWCRFDGDRIISEEEFRKNYKELVAECKKSGGKVIAVQPFAFKMEDKRRFRPYLVAFNEEIEQVAEEENIPVVPMDEIFDGVTQDIAPEQFSVDGVHLTHRGCRYVADNVIKALKKELNGVS